jgi:hypothetical protein
LLASQEWPDVHLTALCERDGARMRMAVQMLPAKSAL